MAAVGSISKTLPGFKSVVIRESKTKRCEEDDNVKYLRIHARSYIRHMNRRPKCGAKCPGYDRRSGNRIRRGLDCGSVLMDVEAAINLGPVPAAWSRDRICFMGL